MKKVIKPFDLEAAKNGAKVECRDGSEVEILKWNMKGDYPILGVIKRNDGSEMIGHWAINEKGDTTSEPFDEELVIVEYKDIPDWKPTDKQIDAIRRARSFVADDFGEHPTLSEILIELEEQLRKIKEEI